ncbi:MAG: DUF4870 domain-containing protein [Acidimicrobiales bacterium]
MTPPPPAPGGPSVSEPAPQAATTVAGWYPAPGGQRYWDGAQWTDHVAPAAGLSVPETSVGISNVEERQMAMFAHLGQLLGLVTGIGGFVAPLIIMLTKGKESNFVRAAAVESLNFWITGLIAGIISFILILALVGIFLLPIVGLVWLGLPIYAGIKANEGVDYRYPFNLRLIT